MWKGPSVDGITQSLLAQYLRCPYCFYIYTILGLKEETPLHPNLIWGDCFHKGLEILIKTKDRKAASEAMDEHLSLYPTAPPTFRHSLKKMITLYTLNGVLEGDWETEVLIDEVRDIDGTAVRFRGKKDGYKAKDVEYDRLLIEHKCKGYIDPIKTKQELHQDLQLNVYMNLFNIEWVVYDLIKIPDTQKYGPAMNYSDSPKEYIDKLYRGPIGSYGGKYPIFLNKSQWMHQSPPYYISLEKQQEFWDRTLTPLIKQLLAWYEHVTQPGFDHENPKYYNELFYISPVRNFDGRQTDNFECEYYSHLIGDQELSDLSPVESYYSELEEV